MNKPLVSVLMPAYNVSKYIEESVNSILCQTYDNFELIIVDDCSTDDTWRIIQDLQKKDGRIVIFKNDKNLGISASRNKLINLSKGEYIVWQDADDISLPLRIEKQVDFMEANTDVGICGGWLEFFYETGASSIRKYQQYDKELRKNIFKYSPVSQGAAIIRKECLVQVGGFAMASPAAEDLELSFRIGSFYKFANLQEVVLRYRQNYNGTTHTRLRLMELYTIFVRYKNHTSGYYHMNWNDWVYNFFQFFSIFLIPPKLKIFLFNLLRNK